MVCSFSFSCLLIYHLRKFPGRIVATYSPDNYFLVQNSSQPSFLMPTLRSENNLIAASLPFHPVGTRVKLIHRVREVPGLQWKAGSENLPGAKGCSTRAVSSEDEPEYQTQGENARSPRSHSTSVLLHPCSTFQDGGASCRGPRV